MTDEEKKIAEKKCREVDEVEYRRQKKREKRVNDRRTKSKRICSHYDYE